MAICFIPARGGSKGIPLKNLKDVHGRSLLMRAIHSALQSDCFTDVYVSTDHDDIATEATASGAIVLWRPDELASDQASTESVLLHHLSNDLSIEGDAFALLQCTSPFISGASLREASELLGRGFDSVFACLEDHSFRWTVDDDRSCIPLGHNRLSRPRRQDLKPSVIETGAFYFARVDAFLAEKTRFCGRVGSIEVSRVEALEIDNHEELQIARQLAEEWDRTHYHAN